MRAGIPPAVRMNVPAARLRRVHMGDSMASDISLAVGDGARRMTYAELATVRGISLASARRLVLRHHWPRQTGNDSVVRVTVPLEALNKPAGKARQRDTVTSEAMSRRTRERTSDRSDIATSAMTELAGFGDYLLQQAWLPTQLYRHYDTEGKLLYVGIAGDAVRRLEEGHRRESHWYRLIARVLIQDIPTRIEARNAEEMAIVVEQPLYNDRTKLRVRETYPPAPILQPIEGSTTILRRAHGDIEVSYVQVSRTLPPDDTGSTVTLSRAVDSLREQLVIANSRADQAELRAADKEVTIAYLRREVETLLSLLTDRRPWWQRWFR